MEQRLVPSVPHLLRHKLIYAMAALEIPPGVIDQVDRRRRSFLWSGNGTSTGGSSMVAWTHVCDTKDMGGLGLKDLGLQNTCLLVKMIHRLHSNNASSWARWVWQNACVASLTGNLHGNHWDTMRALLPLYRAITTVKIADGTTTSFWFDVWDGNDSLGDRFPELFSHCTSKEITVHQAYAGQLQQSLTRRQSAEVTTQLHQVSQIMAQHNLIDGRDQRSSPMMKANGELNTGMLYTALKNEHSTPDAWAKFIWQNKAPPRV